MVVYEPKSQSYITMLLRRIEIRPCALSLKDCNHILLNQRCISYERVGEWTDIFKVSPKHRRPTENHSLSNNLLIMCEVFTSIIAVHGIIWGNWIYQIIPQPVSEGISIYSAKSSDVLFYRFQGLGLVPWIEGRYHFRVLVGLLPVPRTINCADLGYLNICVCARPPNPF